VFFGTAPCLEFNPPAKVTTIIVRKRATVEMAALAVAAARNVPCKQGRRVRVQPVPCKKGRRV